MAGKLKDRTGEKHFRLTFIKATEKRNNQGAVIWELLCECGNKTFASGKDVVSGNTTSCGCYAMQRRSVGGQKNRRFDPVISSARTVWKGVYKDCDFDTFFTLSQEPCYYCGRDPHRTFNVGNTSQKKRKVSHIQVEVGDFTYNGIDRIDSSKGHTFDNIVPCCYRCNQAKNDMPVNEFLDLVKLIYNRRCV